MDERRRHQRVSTEQRVAVFWSWGEALARTANLSAGGALLVFEGAKPPHRGARLRVEITLPNLAAPIRREAVVRWSYASADVLVGIEFQRDLDTDQIDALFELPTAPAG